MVRAKGFHKETFLLRKCFLSALTTVCYWLPQSISTKCERCRVSSRMLVQPQFRPQSISWAERKINKTANNLKKNLYAFYHFSSSICSFSYNYDQLFFICFDFLPIISWYNINETKPELTIHRLYSSKGKYTIILLAYNYIWLERDFHEKKMELANILMQSWIYLHLHNRNEHVNWNGKKETNKRS